MNINEERKLIKLRNGHLITKQNIYKSHIQMNNPLCSLFILHTNPNEPLEREISLSNKATLNQSDLI